MQCFISRPFHIWKGFLSGVFSIYPLPLSCCWGLCNNDGISVIRNLTRRREKEVSVSYITLTDWFVLKRLGYQQCLTQSRHLNVIMTSSWMYWIKKGEARKLSTGKLKKPWISFWCKSMVMMCVNPLEQKDRQVFYCNVITEGKRDLTIQRFTTISFFFTCFS